MKAEDDLPIRKPSAPRNAPPAVAKKQPSEGTTHYEVRTRGVAGFTRAGIDFGPDPVLVEAKELSQEQAVELLNTDTLIVRERGGRGGVGSSMTSSAAMAEAAEAEAADTGEGHKRRR